MAGRGLSRPRGDPVGRDFELQLFPIGVKLNDTCNFEPLYRSRSRRRRNHRADHHPAVHDTVASDQSVRHPPVLLITPLYPHDIRTAELTQGDNSRKILAARPEPAVTMSATETCSPQANGTAFRRKLFHLRIGFSPPRGLPLRSRSGEYGRQDPVEASARLRAAARRVVVVEYHNECSLARRLPVPKPLTLRFAVGNRSSFASKGVALLRFMNG